MFMIYYFSLVLVREKKAMEEKLKELNRAVDFFRDCLGLTFKKTSGNGLLFLYSDLGISVTFVSV